jgi:hypothetical protein
MSAPRHVDVHGISIRITDDDVRQFPALQQQALDYFLAFQAFGRWPEARGQHLPPPDADDTGSASSRGYIFGAPTRRLALRVLAIRELMRERDLDDFKRDINGQAAAAPS